MSDQTNLEAKAFVNKYLADVDKLFIMSGVYEGDDAVYNGIASRFLDRWCRHTKTESLDYMLNDLNLVSEFLLNQLVVKYINVSNVPDPVQERPCSKLFNVFQNDQWYSTTIDLFKNDKDIFEVFGEIGSPTFAMVATYRLVYDALYYEHLQQLKVSNKALFTYLSDTAWVDALANHLDAHVSVHQAVQKL